MASSEHKFAQLRCALLPVTAEKCIMYGARENSC